MYSWSVSVANLSTKPEDFEVELGKHVDGYFEREPPKRHVVDAMKHHTKVAVPAARKLLEELLGAEDKPTPRKLTRDQVAENEKAKRERPDGERPHADPELAVSVTISGLVPTGEPGDHATLSVSVSLG